MKHYNVKPYQLAYKKFYPDAMNGDVASAFDLGHMYQYGSGLKINHLQAAMWLKNSADLANVDAMLELGFINADGGNNMSGDTYV